MRLTVDLPQNLHKQLKKESVTQETSMKQIVIEALEHWLKEDEQEEDKQ